MTHASGMSTRITITGRTAIRYLTAIMSNRDAVESWRGTLSDAEKIKWASPHSVYNRCGLFDAGKESAKSAVKAQPMTLAEFLRLPAGEAATLLHLRCAPKFFALLNAMSDLSETVTRPRSNWRPIDRERAAARERPEAGASAAAA